MQGVLSEGRDVISEADMDECMRIGFTILAPGGTLVTFCAELQFATWREAAVKAGFVCEHVITMIKPELGKKRWFAPHTKIINVVEYILVCKKTVQGLLSFVNFDVDVPGKPHILGSSSSFLVNGNVFSDHKFVKGRVCL